VSFRLYAIAQNAMKVPRHCQNGPANTREIKVIELAHALCLVGSTGNLIGWLEK